MMAVKGETKILVIISICLILISIGLSGCVEDDGNEKGEILTIWVRNKTQNNITCNITISFNENELYNLTKTIQRDDYKKIELNYDYNEYIVNIYYNESIQINKEIKFNEYADHHYFDIIEDQIKYIPPPVP